MGYDEPNHGPGDTGESTSHAAADRDPLTTNSGEPVPDNRYSRRAGPEGPLLMDDYQ